ncbi:hypothetical protein KW799_02610 [Candidatus Parcubacteria bacterium]|nr:hypothetical protein [Candidatus Parcubacteria bacterium]
MKMKFRIYKIRKEKLEKLLTWAKELSTTYKSEALAALREEKVSREYVGIFYIENEPYALCFMEGECLPASDSELNRKHKEVMRDCIETSYPLDTAYDLSE